MKDDDPKYYFYLGLSLEALGNSTRNQYEQVNYYAEALQSYTKVKAFDEKNVFRVSEYIASLEQKAMGRQ